MTEKLLKQWDADPSGVTVVKVYETQGVGSRIRSFFQPTRTLDVPSGVVPGLYEPYPIRLNANQRVVVVKGDEVIMTG